jgi:hypothetical protein
VRQISATLDAEPIRNSLVYRGTCVHCGKPAAKEVHFQEDGFIIVERYCAACLEPENFKSLQKWYARFA